VKFTEYTFLTVCFLVYLRTQYQLHRLYSVGWDSWLLFQLLTSCRAEW